MSLHYVGRPALGAFVSPEDLERIRTLRATGRPGSVTVLDARARRIVVHPERLVVDPQVLGYGADPLGDRRGSTVGVA
ncbi:hypothetical protein [Actinomycetospora flava]|uniref:Uncharacterized protein n=1 Tax=Actinomycetospora flava TaxID=3129232 RepID=A0ABU8LYK7_9PSEU